MKRDLWKELAERARKEAPAAVCAPAGFERQILRRAEGAGTSFFWSPWMPMLRPALALAVAVMGICLAIQLTNSPGPIDSDMLSETDALMITAFFHEQ